MLVVTAVTGKQQQIAETLAQRHSFVDVNNYHAVTVCVSHNS